MKISKEVKTGILVLLGITLFVFGFNYLKGVNLLESNNEYYTEFNYNALSKASLVTVKGNPVGKISDISYNYKTGKTKVAFHVNKELDFSKNSIVRMYETGLMGGNALAIIISKDGEKAQPGDFLKSEVEIGLVTSLSKNFSGLSTDLNTTLKSTDTLMSSLNKLVIDNSETGLKSTISELNKTLKSFKNTSNTVNGLISQNDNKIAEILDMIKTSSNDLKTITSELKKAEISNTVQTLSTTLTNLNYLLDSVNKGQGSVGKLFKDDGLYKNLEGATGELEALLKDIKLHPKRYFRILSKKEIPYTKE